MRAIAFVVLACGAGLALADKDKPKLSAADQKKYKELLDKGRKLEDKKQYADAMTAFDQALAVVKDDATVLAEMGWTAYLAKDYDKAEKYTRQALANQATPNIRGAAFYNLGLVQEKRGDRAGAIASYTESLKARWNATVRGALAKLDPAAAAALDPFKPVAMAGPFATIDAYCKSVKNDLGDDYTCTCGADDKPPHGGAAKPYDAFGWVARSCAVPHTDIATTFVGFAVKVGGSWYVGALAQTFNNRHCTNEVASQAVSIEHGRPVFRVGERGGCGGGNGTSDFTEDQLAVVGIGASGKPSATPPIMVGRHETEAAWNDSGGLTPEKVTVDVKLDVTWTKDGVELKGKTKGGDASLVGKHALAFP